jgi:hypothetical protein
LAQRIVLSPQSGIVSNDQLRAAQVIYLLIESIVYNRILKEHFQKAFVKLGEIGAAIATVKFHLSQDLGVIKFLAETAVTVLVKACSKNNPI